MLCFPRLPVPYVHPYLNPGSYSLEAVVDIACSKVHVGMVSVVSALALGCLVGTGLVRLARFRLVQGRRVGWLQAGRLGLMLSGLSR